MRVKCLAQEHNKMSPVRARTWTARSGVEHANHEAAAPPTYDKGSDNDDVADDYNDRNNSSPLNFPLSSLAKTDHVVRSLAGTICQ